MSTGIDFVGPLVTASLVPFGLVAVVAGSMAWENRAEKRPIGVLVGISLAGAICLVVVLRLLLFTDFLDRHHESAVGRPAAAGVVQPFSGAIVVIPFDSATDGERFKARLCAEEQNLCDRITVVTGE